MRNTWRTALRRTYAGAVAGLVLASAGCSSSSDSPPPPRSERLVYADGLTVHLAKLSGGELVDVAHASIPSAGLLYGQTIFGIVKHPSRPWLYVTSFNDCYSYTDWCWGNARIDRFIVSANDISHDRLMFAYDASATLAACSADTSGFTGQVGSCAPVDGTFSPNGSRLYVQEDDFDVLNIFEVAADGSLTMLSEGGDLDQHGVAMDPSGASTFLYNGDNVLGVSGDVGTNEYTDAGGNYTAYLPGKRLLSTVWTDDVAVYSVADPVAPTVIDQIYLGASAARAVVINRAVNRLVAVGRNSVATIAFDGTSLTLEDSYDPSGGGANVENRSVALLGGGSHAAVSWFKASGTSPSGWVGGIDLYSIDPDGLISTAGSVDLNAPARVVKTLSL